MTPPGRPAPRVRVVSGSAATVNADGTVTITTDSGPIIASNAPAALIVDDQAWAIAGASGGSGGGLPPGGSTGILQPGTVGGPGAGAYGPGDLIVVSYGDGVNGYCSSNVAGWTRIGQYLSVDDRPSTWGGVQVWEPPGTGGVFNPQVSVAGSGTPPTATGTWHFLRLGATDAKKVGFSAWPLADLTQTYTVGDPNAAWTVIQFGWSPLQEVSGIPTSFVRPLGALGACGFGILGPGEHILHMSRTYLSVGVGVAYVSGVNNP